MLKIKMGVMWYKLLKVETQSLLDDFKRRYEWKEE